MAAAMATSGPMSRPTKIRRNLTHTCGNVLDATTRGSEVTVNEHVGTAETTADPRRWKALAVLALIQFMLILDVTVVNVALPHIQSDLGFSRAGLAWVVNG